MVSREKIAEVVGLSRNRTAGIVSNANFGEINILLSYRDFRDSVSLCPFDFFIPPPRLLIKPPPTISGRLPMEIPFSTYNLYSFRVSPILFQSQVI